MLTNVMNLSEYIKSLGLNVIENKDQTVSCSADGCDNVGPAKLFSVGTPAIGPSGFYCPGCAAKNSPVKKDRHGYTERVRCQKCDGGIYNDDVQVAEVIGGVVVYFCRYCCKNPTGEESECCSICGTSVATSKLHKHTKCCNGCQAQLKKCGDCDDWHFSGERYLNMYLSSHKGLPEHTSVGCTPKKVYSAEPILDILKAEVSRIAEGMHKPFYFRDLASL